MKKKTKKKDDEGYYSISFFIAIGLGIVSITITLLSTILKRFW